MEEKAGEVGKSHSTVTHFSFYPRDKGELLE